jgi:tetratricopeptide (TPR) repeat protein
MMVAGVMALTGTAFGGENCAGGARLDEVKAFFETGKNYEKAGELKKAAGSYDQALTFACDAQNPEVLEVAKRLSPIVLNFANDEEQRGNYEGAYWWFELGGHYAAADRMMLKILRAAPNDPQTVERVRRHFEGRSAPSFAAQNMARIIASGDYKLDRRMSDEVARLSPTGSDKAVAGREPAAVTVTVER